MEYTDIKTALEAEGFENVHDSRWLPCNLVIVNNRGEIELNFDGSAEINNRLVPWPAPLPIVHQTLESLMEEVRRVWPKKEPV